MSFRAWVGGDTEASSCDSSAIFEKQTYAKQQTDPAPTLFRVSASSVPHPCSSPRAPVCVPDTRLKAAVCPSFRFSSAQRRGMGHEAVASVSMMAGAERQGWIKNRPGRWHPGLGWRFLLLRMRSVARHVSRGPAALPVRLTPGRDPDSIVACLGGGLHAPDWSAWRACECGVLQTGWTYINMSR